MRFVLSYLLDENINHAVASYLSEYEPDLHVYLIGPGGVLAKGTLDPEVLVWCESSGCVLVTDNRKSMPVHLADHLAAGRHVEGVFQVGRMTVGELCEHLVEVAEASFPGEYRDSIRHLPIT